MPARRPETRERLSKRDRDIVATFKADRTMSYAVLGQRFGLCESRICHIIRKARAHRTRAINLRDRDIAILRMAENDPAMTREAIGLHFGICATSVTRAMQRAAKIIAARQAMVAQRLARRQAMLPQLARADDVSPASSASPATAPVTAAATSRAVGLIPIRRDPCPRCGVRGDLGCSHRSAMQ